MQVGASGSQATTLSYPQVALSSTSTMMNSISLPTSFTIGSLDVLIHMRRKRAIRSKNAIVVAILEACRTPSVQHWIMVKARLGYDTFWHHMNQLLSMGMMDSLTEGSKTLYRINAKGLNFLQQLET